MKQVFESDRIRFVEVSECLIRDYIAMFSDHENVSRWFSGGERVFTAEQELEWVRDTLEKKAAVFSMLEKKSGMFIGNIELKDPKDAEGELGIVITAQMQNQGYGTEAVLAMTKFGREQLGLKRIFLRTKPSNARAIHVYEKCGFREYDRDSVHVYMEMP